MDLPYLAANRSRLSERDHQCAYHFAGESQRVIFGARALRDGDFAQFGQYMIQSHESSRDFFRNSCPDLDLLDDHARVHPASLGARLTGGGFGGATPGNCLDCIANSCPEANECFDNPRCVQGLFCGATACGGFEGTNAIRCWTACFDGDAGLAFQAIAAGICLAQTCSMACQGF